MGRFHSYLLDRSSDTAGPSDGTKDSPEHRGGVHSCIVLDLTSLAAPNSLTTEGTILRVIHSALCHHGP